MINLLKKILNDENSSLEKKDNSNLDLLCGLMIEAAYTDGQIEKIELDNYIPFGSIVKVTIIGIY